MCDCVSTAQHRAAVPPGWISQAGRVAHPDSPAGAGGAGTFRQSAALGGSLAADLLPDPQSPIARNFDPVLIQLAGEAEADKVKRQPAPRVKVDAPDEVVQGILTLKLKADESGVSGIGSALTSFFETNNGAQVLIHTDEKGMVDGLSNDLAWTIEIVTQYGSGDPELDSAYGRGTTQADKAAGNVTLGFHESCHRDDLLSYFRSEAIPVLGIDFPNDKKIPKATAEKARSAYLTAWKAYFDKIRKLSVAKTDEAPGSDPPLSKYKATPAKP